MSFLLQQSKIDKLSIGKNWGLFFGFGIALVALGALAISYACLTTITSIIFLGCFLLAGGSVIIVDAFQFWRGKGSGFFIHLIMGILYVVAGMMLIGSPLLGGMALTLILATFYTIVGTFRIIYSLIIDFPRRGWRLVNGLITLLIGVLILTEWPVSGIFVIGVFIGIDLLIAGWVYILAALSARSLVSKMK